MFFKTIFNEKTGGFKNKSFLSDFDFSKGIGKGLKNWWSSTPYNIDLIKLFNNKALGINFDADDAKDKFEKLKQEFVDLAGDDKVTGALFQNAKEGVEVTVNAIDNLTPAAKAGKVALKGLAAVGNMFASWAIMFAIEKTIQQKRLYRFFL